MEESVFNPRNFDRAWHAAQARITGGLSYISLLTAWTDWALQVGDEPGHQLSLLQHATRDMAKLTRLSLGLSAETLQPPPTDHRFSHPSWQHGPWALAVQAFLRLEHLWDQATGNVRGLSREDKRIVNFVARQLLDMVAPPNFPLFNPEVLTKTQETAGDNLRLGLRHFIADLQSLGSSRAQPLPLQPGKDVAVTPGAVIYRNEVIELIQYSPTTETVRPEPILIVPAWIMKYYILDLSPHNSMIRYLVSQGFTVFCISWRNPGPEQRNLSLEDYRRLGVMAAMDAVTAVCGPQKIHATGYCLGGTLLTIAAAAIARDHDDRLGTMTLLAAQTDFTEAGELQLFITASQLAFLDDVMWAQGYLDSSQMSGAFQMLRSNDMIWSRLIRRYYLGEEEHPNDLMSWNQDGTRMPYRMHSEYLRRLFLENDLAEGRFEAGGHKISLTDIRPPFFVIGTETDHIAPWHSVYKLQLHNQNDFTFILTSGGHNAGVVSEPGHRNRHYRMLHRSHDDLYVPPEEWLAHVTPVEGSWWPAWVQWLNDRSSAPVKPPPMGAPLAGYPVLDKAPGQYIYQR